MLRPVLAPGQTGTAGKRGGAQFTVKQIWPLSASVACGVVLNRLNFISDYRVVRSFHFGTAVTDVQPGTTGKISNGYKDSYENCASPWIPVPCTGSRPRRTGLPDFRDGFYSPLPILVIPEDGPVPVSPVHHVINGAPDIPIVICEPCRILCFRGDMSIPLTDTFFDDTFWGDMSIPLTDTRAFAVHELNG